MRAMSLLAMAVVGCFVLGATPAEAAKRGAKTHVIGVLNLNQATANQLDLLPGVGQKAAKRILEYRTKTPFTKAEELVKVKGFGKKRFEKLKPFLAVAGTTTLKQLPGGAGTALDDKPDGAPPQGRTGKATRR